MKISIPEELGLRLQKEANGLNIPIEKRLHEILDRNLAPNENFNEENIQNGLRDIQSFLRSIPCIGFLSNSESGEAYWWVKFRIDTNSKIAWHVIQELGHVLNYISINEKLPTRFYPVSPPPYLNGGPGEFLSWVIEAVLPFVDSTIICEYLKGRLPEDPENEDSWLSEI